MKALLRQVVQFSYFGFALAVLGSSTARADGFVLNPFQTNTSVETLMAQVNRAADLGVSTFSVPLLLCQASRTANEVAWCPGSDMASLAGLSRAIIEKGFRLTYLPVVMSADGAWRGTFEPERFESWSASYSKLIREIAVLAREAGVSAVAVGSEFSTLYRHEHFWRQLIWDARALHPTAKIFAVSNWDRYREVHFWADSDYVALSAYFPLANGFDSPTDVQSLATAWLAWKTPLVDFARALGKRIYFAEVGYGGTALAAMQPWNNSGIAAKDHALQARLFEAFGRTWGTSSDLAQFEIWSLTPSPEPENDLGYDVFGKPAEAAVAEIFRMRKP